jgi:hypothetical protein
MRPKQPSTLALFVLVAVCATTSCSLPTGSHKVSTVIALRWDTDGKPLESVREDETISKHFYLFTPDGPFVTKAWPSKFDYSLIAGDGSQHRLRFLTTREVYEQYLACFPISQGRWIGIAPLANAPIENSLHVCVFNRDVVLSSATVPACDHDDEAALRAARDPQALRSSFRFYAYDFDPRKEAVTFSTRSGRLIFHADDGELQKVQE